MGILDVEESRSKILLREMVAAHYLEDGGATKGKNTENYDNFISCKLYMIYS